MCIRDRLQNGEDMITIIKEMEAEQESEEETADGEETAEEETDPSEYDNVVSVSNTSVPEVYRTERDVYKRQTHRCTAHAPIEPLQRRGRGI